MQNKTVQPARKFRVNIKDHHALCEMNFHCVVRLLPGLRDGVERWSFSAGEESEALNVSVEVLEAAPYTTTIMMQQCRVGGNEYLCEPRIVIRLYHDVGMAEIVSWDNHRHWQPQYCYPNDKMYLPNEKFALNQFLSEWLQYCRQQGLYRAKSVIQFS